MTRPYRVDRMGDEMKRWVYEVMYRLPVPVGWIFGSDADIGKVVESAILGRIQSGRAIALGCGVGREAISLARHGFLVTGVDFSPTAIARARGKAATSGVHVEFVVDDLTDLKLISGQFDLVTDFGAINDLDRVARDAYMRNVIPLTHPGSLLVMFCFKKKLPRSEVDRRFGPFFDIETVESIPETRFPASLDFYVMTRT